MNRLRPLVIVGCLVLGLVVSGGAVAQTAEDTPNPFRRENLTAWCVVPFDAKQRGPEARAEMLTRHGIFNLAYDWRAEHIPQFDEEMTTLKRWGIDLQAFWFPAGLNEDAQKILAVLERHQIETELWVSMHGGEIECTPEEQAQRIADHVAALRPIVDAAAAINCKVGLYNHGGWFGEPENQIAILEALDAPNVGIVYNLHHGHHHLDRFEELLALMKPHLYSLNLNGMDTDGDQTGNKILPIGLGEHDLRLFRIIQESGYTGPIGVLGHTMDDAEETLADNLDGIDWLVKQLAGEDAGARPGLRVKRERPDTAWQIEDPKRRAALPPFQVYPAARTEALSPARETPHDYYTTWTRSHGDPHNTRFAQDVALSPANVHLLEQAWVYRSEDGAGNIQSNPIVVGDTIYAPTTGQHLVAIDARSGKERWRYKPEAGPPAFRGLTYWPGNDTHPARLIFTAGDFLYALDPASGQPLASFAGGTPVPVGESRAAPVIFEDLIILALFEKDIVAHDLHTGERRWIFHTVPQPGEYGHDTWSAPGAGANCWGGIALDEGRGMVFAATGSPKPNFAGNGHTGQNLFANCVIALDARTGARRWHFQEIRHDIWDLDIPAPPILTAIERDNIMVDVVIQVTKLGNTLVLDRETGASLFPIRLRRAPTSKLPGERTWPYQPDIQQPRPFARLVFHPDHITDRTDAAAQDIADRIASANYGFFEPFEENVPTVLYGIHGGAEWTGATVDPEKGILYVSSNDIPWIITVFRPDPPHPDPDAPPTPGKVLYDQHCAQCHGPERFGIGMYPPLHGLAQRVTEAELRDMIRSGKGLMPALDEAALPESDIEALADYLYLRDRPAVDAEALTEEAPPLYTHNGYPELLAHENYPGTKGPWGTLTAIDLRTGAHRWQRPLGYYPEHCDWGIEGYGAENFGGPSLSGQGVVFAAGSPSEEIYAFDAETGAELWRHQLPFGAYAPPTLYHLDEQPYVLVPVTGGGKLATPQGDAYIAFAIPQ